MSFNSDSNFERTLFTTSNDTCSLPEFVCVFFTCKLFCGEFERDSSKWLSATSLTGIGFTCFFDTNPYATKPIPAHASPNNMYCTMGITVLRGGYPIWRSIDAPPKVFPPIIEDTKECTV